MSSPYLNAEPYGIGELIQLKKSFRVPEHQRDYSWTEEEVSTYIEDILAAIKRNAGDYFIGLIVLIGPRSGAWEILDGQQRVATTTMLFSAIRQWLDAAGFEEDARQIEEEFIGLRQLGQTPSSRLTMNVNDREIFSELVFQKTPLQQVKNIADAAPKHSSKKSLATAAAYCRMAVESWAMEGGTHKEKQVAQIYRLAQFLEQSVKVVCLELDSEVDAYMIFESLNFRGQDLSVLDLVKNHIYSLAPIASRETVSKDWTLMRSNISDRDADDFLKVFWTSRHGRVQRGGLFSLVRDFCSSPSSVVDLSKALLAASEPYIAIEEPLHEIWSQFSATCAEHIATLVLLRNKQIRPVILSALEQHFSSRDLEEILWFLVVLTVRYQTVGRRRAGPLELACARLAPEIADGIARTAVDVIKPLRSIMPTDEEFRADFTSYTESQPKRALYMLSSIEAHLEHKTSGYNSERVRWMISSPSPITASRMLPKKPMGEWAYLWETDPDFYSQGVDLLGNWFILETELYRQLGSEELQYVLMVLRNSRLQLTRKLAESYNEWNREVIINRQHFLAELAVDTWKV
jgi:hypothetical protein